MNAYLKLGLDLGPLVVFFVAYARAGLMSATAAFMAATAAALGITYLLTRRVALMPLVTGAIVMVFGGLTLILDDELFIKLKPTVVYALFALALFGGLAVRRPLLKPLLGMMVPLDEIGWRALTLRWAWYFLACAALNEIVWRNFPTDVWITVKVFGFAPLTLLFALAQIPLIQRHRAVEQAQPD